MAAICTITSNLFKIKLVLAKRVFLWLEIIFRKQFIQFLLFHSTSRWLPVRFRCSFSFSPMNSHENFRQSKIRREATKKEVKYHKKCEFFLDRCFFDDSLFFFTPLYCWICLCLLSIFLCLSILYFKFSFLFCSCFSLFCFVCVRFFYLEHECIFMCMCVCLYA